MGKYVPTKLEKKLIDLCVEIEAHAECGWQVRLGGNGINAAEASGVAWVILEMLPKLDKVEYQKAVEDRARALKEEFDG